MYLRQVRFANKLKKRASKVHNVLHCGKVCKNEEHKVLFYGGVFKVPKSPLARGHTKHNAKLK